MIGVRRDWASDVLEHGSTLRQWHRIVDGGQGFGMEATRKEKAV